MHKGFLRIGAWGASVLGVLALMLASTRVYGVVAYTASNAAGRSASALRSEQRR